MTVRNPRLRSGPVPLARAGTALSAAGLGVLALVLVTSWLRPSGDGSARPVLDLGDALRAAPDCPEPLVAEGERPPVDEVRVDVALVVSSPELVRCPRSYDGRSVAYEGEVVGAVLDRRDEAWFQVNDDPYAARDAGPLPSSGRFAGLNTGIGVLAPIEARDDVASVGGPGRRGAIVHVEGTFHRVDPRTHEVGIIRADRLRVVDAGGSMEGSSDPRLPVVALATAALAGLLVVLERRGTRR